MWTKQKVLMAARAPLTEMPAYSISTQPSPLMNSKSPIPPRVGDSNFHVMAKWKWHLQTLLRLRDRFQRETREHVTEAETLERADPGFAAQASNESEFETLIAQVKAEEGLLAEVESALERLRDSTYGICVTRQTHYGYTLSEWHGR